MLFFKLIHFHTWPYFPLAWSLFCCNFPLKYSTLPLCALQFCVSVISQAILLHYHYQLCSNYHWGKKDLCYLHVRSHLCVCVSVCFLTVHTHVHAHTVLTAPVFILRVVFMCLSISPLFRCSHPVPPPRYYLLPWLQGSPGFCTPSPAPPPNPQRSGEHTSSQGHAHHHQVKENLICYLNCSICSHKDNVKRLPSVWILSSFCPDAHV